MKKKFCKRKIQADRNAIRRLTFDIDENRLQEDNSKQKTPSGKYCESVFRNTLLKLSASGKSNQFNIVTPSEFFFHYLCYDRYTTTTNTHANQKSVAF